MDSSRTRHSLCLCPSCSDFALILALVFALTFAFILASKWIIGPEYVFFSGAA